LEGYVAAIGNGANTFNLAPGMRATPTATQVGSFTNTNIATTALYPGATSLTWEIATTAGGNFRSIGNLGGFTLDARL
jgi:hypothetical protein